MSLLSLFIFEELLAPYATFEISMLMIFILTVADHKLAQEGLWTEYYKGMKQPVRNVVVSELVIQVSQQKLLPRTKLCICSF